MIMGFGSGNYSFLQIEGKPLDAKPLSTRNPAVRHPFVETDIFENYFTNHLTTGNPEEVWFLET